MSSEISDFVATLRWIDALISILERSDPWQWDQELVQPLRNGTIAERAELKAAILAWLRELQERLAYPGTDADAARSETMTLALGVLLERLRSREEYGARQWRDDKGGAL